MDSSSLVRGGRLRGSGLHEPVLGTRQTQSRNKQWVAGELGQRSGTNTPHNDGDRWERGGHRGGRGSRGSRGRGKLINSTLRTTRDDGAATEHSRRAEEQHLDDDPVESEERSLDSAEDRDKFYQELVKAREMERKKAIAEGKMDDPAIPKRLEDAISVVGTCLDMCPRFERYRRERENNLFEWETIPGTKRVDHKRAVKMYERAAGDKTLPSDLRPPHVLKRTLDYLFHDLLSRGGFSQTFNFIRDRSRAVRNDFTMQHNYGPVAIECHDRCARFHILALHFKRDQQGFSITLEEQQLMNTLQSLKEFYEDQRGRYESPTELEMRVYHRLIHIRDQKERHEDIPEHILTHPVFQLTTDFRLHVQRKSAPISKVSALVVDEEGMQIFAKLANVLREQGSVVMIYLVACILERLFGKDAIEDIESIRGDLSIPDIIDGVSSAEYYQLDDEMRDDLGDGLDEISHNPPSLLNPGGADWLTAPFDSNSTTSALEKGDSVPAVGALKPVSAFSTIATTPNVFGTPSPFANSVFASSSGTTFGTAVSSTPSLPTSTAPAKGISAFPNPSAINGLREPSFVSNPFGSTAPPALVGSSDFAPTGSSVAPPLPSAPFIFNDTARSSPSSKPQNSVSHFGHFGGSPQSNVPPSPPKGFPASVPFPDSGGTRDTTPNPNASISTPKFSSAPPPFHKGFHRASISTPSSISQVINTPQIPVDVHASSSSSQFSLPSVSVEAPSPQPPLRQRSSSQRSSATPPFLPKIDTTTTTASAIKPIQHTQPPTPVVPPSLPKKQPISLPSTPTTAAALNPLLGFLKDNLDTKISGSSDTILSPLYISSPTFSGHSIVHNFTPNGTSKSTFRTSPERLHVLRNGKGKAPIRIRNSVDDNETDNEYTIPEDLLNRIATFSHKSLLVKQCFERWKTLATDRAAWMEACRQSDTYREKIQWTRQSLATRSESKRRVSMSAGLDGSPQKKRARKRMSITYQPRQTDEELAQRFKENHEEHERRWAQGSFLQVIETHVKAKLMSTAVHPAWRVWLSMNPESDATAIWLERKFDVPSSGQWATETIFSISPTSAKDSTIIDSPGIIVFECTPLEDINDELERKYRVLDDCSRLRDIINVLPSRRYFMPSLLVMSWTDEEQPKPPADFLDMLCKIVEQSLVQDFSFLPITSAAKDLDKNFGEALGKLSLDLVGKYVRPLNIRGASKLFEPSFMSFISEWIENCSINGLFDWNIFGRLIYAAVDILNWIVQSILSLIDVDKQKPFLPFDGEVGDNSSAYESISLWLSNADLGEDAKSMIINLQSHRNIGQDFPAREFLDQLWELAQLQVERIVQPRSPAIFYISVEGITASLESYQLSFEHHKVTLGQALNLSIRRSPKRRSVSVDTELVSSQRPKRRRVSQSVEPDKTPSPTSSPYINGCSAPSPTDTTTSIAHSEAPQIVTIAMLRELTRDIKRKYAAGG